MEEAEGRSGEFVTVRRYRDLSEAIVAKSLLESAGIPAWIRDENVARLEWQYSNLLGGLRLQVRADQESAAEEILAQPMPETIAFDAQEKFEQPKCPVCGSIDIAYEGASRKAALLSVSALAVPLPLGATSWTCHACGARWHDSEDERGHAVRAMRADVRSDFAQRLGCGALPAAFATGLLYVAGLPGYTAMVRWSALGLAAAALWLGRKWIAGTRITRWAGICLAIAIVFNGVLGVFGFDLGFSWVILPLLFLAVLGALGDLFVSQPHKGRFARARAERRGLPE
jgi:hypothetical protein